MVHTGRGTHEAENFKQATREAEIEDAERRRARLADGGGGSMVQNEAASAMGPQRLSKDQRHSFLREVTTYVLPPQAEIKALWDQCEFESCAS